MDETRKAVLEELARLLAKAWPDPANRVRIERDMFPHNREEAYFVQDGMHRLLGGAVSGWKVGPTMVGNRYFGGDLQFCFYQKTGPIVKKNSKFSEL